MPKVIQESWGLNSNSTTSIPSGNRADGTANKWSDIWKYQVPTGQAHILKPGFTFSAYLEDASAEIGNGTGRIRIEIRDQSEQDAKSIYGPALYVASKEFQDSRKKATLDLQSDTAIEERFFIVVLVNDDGAIDESDSYFLLETIRVRSGL